MAGLQQLQGGPARLGRLVWPLLLGSALAGLGCADKRDVTSVWAMPAMPSDLRHTSAQRWPYAPPTGPDGVSPHADDDVPRGDLPETAELSRSDLWRTDEALALAEARDTGRGVVISFMAEWSKESMKLELGTFQNHQVRTELLAHYVPLRVDITEETQTQKGQLERYQVYALPVILVLDPRGRPIDRMEELITPEALVSRLRDARERLGQASRPSADASHSGIERSHP